MCGNKEGFAGYDITIDFKVIIHVPSGLVVRISRSHRDGRGSIPRLGRFFSYPLWKEEVMGEGISRP